MTEHRTARRTRFVLASASPARLRTLRAAGVNPEVVVSEVDEQALAASLPGAPIAQLVQRLAAAKAEAIQPTLREPALVLGCDSLLDLGGEALGKPGSPAAAVQFWYRIRGREAVLRTGHCLIDTATGRRSTTAVATVVRFGELSDEEVELYCASGEPATVAGAFTIDGLGGWFVEHIDGDHHNVVGLSLPALRRMLHELGYRLGDLGYPPA